MVKVLLPLDVTSSREGYLRIRGYFSIMAILFLTAGWCLLYELQVMTVVDNDTRDMVYDYRVTRGGIKRYHKMLATAYWSTKGTNSNWDKDVYRPSEDIPCVLVFSGSPNMCMRIQSGQPVNVCAQMAAAVEKSVMRYPGLLRVVNSNGGAEPVPQLQVYFNRLQQPESLITPNSVSQAEVDIFIDIVVENYVDPEYIPPREQGDDHPVALWDSVEIEGNEVTTVLNSDSWVAIGKFGWPWELAPWGPGKCPDTAYDHHYLSGRKQQRRPSISISGGLPVLPRLKLSFLKYQRASIDWYSVESVTGGLVRVAPLTNVTVRILMVPQAGKCCAWQLQEVIGEYSEPQAKTGRLIDIGSFFPATSTTVSLRIEDFAQSEPPYFPKLKGPALIYCGIIFGGFSFIMLGLTPVWMFVIQHNVMVNNGLPPPWFTYTTKYRGW